MVFFIQGPRKSSLPGVPLSITATSICTSAIPSTSNLLVWRIGSGHYEVRHAGGRTIGGMNTKTMSTIIVPPTPISFMWWSGQHPGRGGGQVHPCPTLCRGSRRFHHAVERAAASAAGQRPVDERTVPKAGKSEQFDFRHNTEPRTRPASLRAARGQNPTLLNR